MISWSGFRPVGKEQEYLIDALSSGWVSGGSYVRRLEESLESLFKGSRALAVANGTSALQMAFQTLGANSGDEIIVPSFCFQAASNVAVQLGLSPVFCDVDKSTWNQSVETIEQAYSENTKGIVIVHNYGVAAPSRQICEWAHERGLWVIEDCAEAWFSKNDGRYVGEYGDIATFSMHATKTIASGEGGVVLVNDDSLYERATLVRSHGISRNEKHYFHVLPGNNYRLSNLLCAVALAQLEKHETILEEQRRRSRLYRDLLGEHWAIDCQQGLGARGEDEVWANAVYVLCDKLSGSRDTLIDLLESRNIEVRPGFYAASSLPYFAEKHRMFSRNADDLAENIIVLPTNGSVTEEQVGRICDELLRLIEANVKGT